MSNNLRWRKMKKRDAAGTEALLRETEEYCVGACGRFLKRNAAGDHIWTLQGKTAEISALIIHSRSTLMPVLCGQKEIPPPYFLGGLLGPAPVHSVQGLGDEVIILEKALQKQGRKAAQNIDYYLMVIDKLPHSKWYSAGPSGLILRKPEYTDLDALAALQAGYEQEEVLPKGAVFNPVSSRINAARIIEEARILCAELEGRLVGKINVSAVSFTRFQVGGVYVHPDYRGRGIARRMTVQFIGSLVGQGRGVTLFVKKSNSAACKLYDDLGFTVKGDYRITYY